MMKKLVDEIKKIASDIGLDSRLKVLEYQRLWENTAGDAISKQTSVVSVKDKTLIISVDSSVWLNELMFMKKDILNKLRQNSALCEIYDLRFVLCAENKFKSSTSENKLNSPPKTDIPLDVTIEIKKLVEKFPDSESSVLEEIIKKNYLNRQKILKNDSFMKKVCEIMNYLRKEPGLDYFELLKKYGKYSVDEYYFALYNR